MRALTQFHVRTAISSALARMPKARFARDVSLRGIAQSIAISSINQQRAFSATIVFEGSL
jgi:hypothetical protein